MDQFQYIIPPEIDKDDNTRSIFIEAMENSQKAYDKLANILQEKYILEGMKKKQAEKKKP